MGQLETESERTGADISIHYVTWKYYIKVYKYVRSTFSCSAKLKCLFSTQGSGTEKNSVYMSPTIIILLSYPKLLFAKSNGVNKIVSHNAMMERK